MTSRTPLLSAERGAALDCPLQICDPSSIPIASSQGLSTVQEKESKGQAADCDTDGKQTTGRRRSWTKFGMEDRAEWQACTRTGDAHCCLTWDGPWKSSSSFFFLLRFPFSGMCFPWVCAYPTYVGAGNAAVVSAMITCPSGWSCAQTQYHSISADRRVADRGCMKPELINSHLINAVYKGVRPKSISSVNQCSELPWGAGRKGNVVSVFKETTQVGVMG